MNLVKTTISAPTNTPTEPTYRIRIASIDVFRGLVMFLMLFQVVRLHDLAEQKLKATPESDFWQAIQLHTEHVEWEGGSLHDMIQPGFSFLVGAALAFSLVNRRSKGQSWPRMFFHAILRSVALVALGVLLRNLKTERINYEFADTLCQIGLGYAFLFVIATLPKVWHYVMFCTIVIGWWIAFASYPTPPADFDYASVGVASEWPHHKTGIAAHWNKNTNLASSFDRWFLNKFPRSKPFTANAGGYCTLNSVPTLATMLLGLIAGGWFRPSLTFGARTFRFLAGIILCLGLAWLVSYMGLCPIVKRIWTPTWVLWSGGICLAFLYVFHLVCDVGGFKGWAFPLTVIGANSIAAYVMSFATVPFLRNRIDSWLGFLWKSSGIYAPHILGLTVLMIVWLILFWMHRRKLYIRL
jgi:heparan-alpha-glucosaminide N-acetyltransferase